ncbi:MAG: hypothetical protein BAJALOKI1v1_1590002 [Promethearchaeota archaeon]|nr:MAG: hypothetical protein BAJALOKI1v1_1590002 [Candidatus Lokiarchaeota archaeon]
MSVFAHIDKNVIESIMGSMEFKAFLLSRRWFGDKFLLSNLQFQIKIDYFQILAERIYLTVIKITKPDYEKLYFMPLIYYRNLNNILAPKERNKENIRKLTENTFSKKIALTIEKDQKIVTLNLLEAEYCLYFWKNMLFDKTISEKFPELSLKLVLYTEQFQDELNMEKVQTLIEASIYTERYEAFLTQLGKGNTTNMLFKLTLKNKKQKNAPSFSYVLKSYKEYRDSLEPSTLQVLNKNQFSNSPKIYGNIKVNQIESMAILEYLANEGNVGDIYWTELNDMINAIFSDLNADFSKLQESKELSELIKKYCEKSLILSERIGKCITNLHEALILAEQPNYSVETVESDFYLKNYTHKLNLMINNLQLLMKQESEKLFYNLTKIQTVFIDAKDVLEKFRGEFEKNNLRLQPVHQDLHMEQILYDKTDSRFDFYFMDFEGDPELSLEERKQKFPIEKDIASYLRSLSYIKFNTLLSFIEKNVINKDEYVVPEELLYSLFFRKGFREKHKELNVILTFLNKWEQKIMTKILKNLEVNITLINYFTIERILHEVIYEILFRPKKFLVPLLGLKEVIDNN